ncbi:MAG: Gfo/Idh/MocA family oxidoreductase [Bryobacteraceae bacterium]
MQKEQAAVSRRKFIGGGGAAVAGAFTVVRPEVVRGTQANSAVTVGLAGVGNRGSYDASIFEADPRARVTALCDLFDDRIEPGIQTIKCEKPTIYKDYEKLLASDVDVVLIATPPFEHPRMLEAAIQAKKHIYCEKPMGVDTAGCRRVIAAGRKADPTKCISTGFQQRYGPVYLEAYRRIQAGELGEITNARAFWIDRDPFTRKPYPDPKIEKLRNWFCYRDYSGDFIIEQDCHNLDVLHWFLGGLPTRAIGWGGRKVRTTMDILDHLNLTYEFPKGIHVNFEANQLTPRPFKRVGEEFTGTKSVIATSRQSMIHYKGTKPETIVAKRDITIDAVETFIGRVQSGKVENVAERSALSTMIAILGRTALYTGREATWKGLFGS